MDKENKAYFSENCRICKAPFKKEHIFKEMMFGFRDEFLYQECSSCGCLQIAELPVDIEKYYPPYYYSFNLEIPKLKKLPFFKGLFAELRLKKKYSENTESIKYLKPLKTKTSGHILDVGCGKGRLICEMFNQGFINVSGVDKFMPEEINHGLGVKVLKKELSELPKSHYDIIMMHHVLEHMDQQQVALRDCNSLLKPNGCLIVRIPLIGEAWELFKHNWVQLDAPRHFFLHTLKSMSILAQQTGFEIRETMFDSTAFQFLGSKLYQKNIPLFTEENNYQPQPFDQFFSHEEIKTYEARAMNLNEHNRGDSAIFYLFKI